LVLTARLGEKKTEKEGEGIFRRVMATTFSVPCSRWANLLGKGEGGEEDTKRRGRERGGEKKTAHHNP